MDQKKRRSRAVDWHMVASRSDRVSQKLVMLSGTTTKKNKEQSKTRKMKYYRPPVALFMFFLTMPMAHRTPKPLKNASGSGVGKRRHMRLKSFQCKGIPA